MCQNDRERERVGDEERERGIGENVRYRHGQRTVERDSDRDRDRVREIEIERLRESVSDKENQMVSLRGQIDILRQQVRMTLFFLFSNYFNFPINQKA